MEATIYDFFFFLALGYLLDVKLRVPPFNTKVFLNIWQINKFAYYLKPFLNQF
jgi:hypothetical protein